jgi:SAM-dependent methyltransferase
VVRAIIAVFLLLTLACNRPAEKPVAAAAKPTAVVPAPVPTAVPAVPQDEAAIIDRTKQFVEGVDTGDADAVAAMLADGFMHVIPGRFLDAEFLLSRLRARKQSGYPRYSNRTYDLTKARFYGDTAIVTTTTSATLLRAEGVAPGTSAHTMTLVWSWQGGAWRLTTWNEADAGREMDRIAWNRTYRDGGSVKLDPNQLLIDTVRGLEPGKALDLGIGQGRNAIYLASQGWDVTGVDISDEGISRANEAAKASGLEAKMHTHIADFHTWDFGENQYDLVGFIYMGPKPPVDEIRRALKPGGIVVFEHFGVDPTKGNGVAGLRQGDLTALFEDGFEVLRDEQVVDVADWGHAKVPLIRFVAKKL